MWRKSHKMQRSTTKDAKIFSKRMLNLDKTDRLLSTKTSIVEAIIFRRTKRLHHLPLPASCLPPPPSPLFARTRDEIRARTNERTNAPTIWSFGRVLTLHYRQQTVLSLYLVHILIIVFYRAVRLTGPFVTMVYSMITGDMLTFGIIYMVVLFGFCQSFYFLYKGFPGVKSSLYSSYHSTWMALFQITLGDYNVSHHRPL